MGNYILLRNNKQTGPHTIEELKEMGLKVYDLIWIEGKSAAWLYAEEVPELAPFTPKIGDIVEESFLEKRATAKIPSVLEQFSKPGNVNAATTAIVSETASSQKASAVAVQMPGTTAHQQDTKEKATDTNKKKTPVAKPVKTAVEKVVADASEYTGAEKKQPVDNSNNEQPSIKYSRSLDDIKQEYVSKVLTKETFANKKSLPVMMLLGVGVLLLIGVGMIIGLLIGNNKQQVSFIPQQKNTIEKKPPAKKTFTPLPVKKVQPATEDKKSGSVEEDDFVYNDDVEIKPPQKTTASKPKKEKTNTSSVNTVAGGRKQEQPVNAQTDITPVVKKQHESTVSTKKENLRELLVVSARDYKKTGVFGGLKDITVTAVNKSSYLVDLAVVEVNYILANGKIFKTEILYFKNIAPGASVSRKASNSPRGVKIESRLTLVSSKSAESITDLSYISR